MTYIWLVTTGHPTGIELKSNLEADNEDYCDLGELLNESQFDWLGSLAGTVDGMRWTWDGNGSPNYLSNSVLNVVAKADI